MAAQDVVDWIAEIKLEDYLVRYHCTHLGPSPALYNQPATSLFPQSFVVFVVAETGPRLPL
jgi:hypothetical protein